MGIVMAAPAIGDCEGVAGCESEAGAESGSCDGVEGEEVLVEAGCEGAPEVGEG